MYLYAVITCMFTEMASSESCQVQDSLSCDVCFEEYDSTAHLPKTLPCQHTFCDSCIKSLLFEGYGGFECPVCRGKVTEYDEVHTNFAVKDIVEAVIAKERAKLFCPKHPAKECQLVCTDCCQLLCAVCMIKAEHVGHTVDDVDDAKGKMKKRLTTAIEKKIVVLEKTARKVKLTHCEEELDAIVYMIIEALNEWKKIQLHTAQQTIDKELESRKAQQALWKEKVNMSDLQSILTACKEAEAEESLATVMSLPKIDLNVMQSKLSSLCDTIQKMIDDNKLSPSPSSWSLTPSHTSWDFIVHLCSSHKTILEKVHTSHHE